MADEKDIEQKIKLTYETNAKKTAKEVDKLDDSIDKTTESQKESAKQSKEQKKGLDSLGGGIGATIKGFKGLIKQAWLLVANPVGLIIAAIALALGGLFKAFTSTKGGAEKLDQVMAGLGAVIDVVRDRVLKIFGVLKKLFSGDIIGAAEAYKEVFVGMGDEIAEEFKKAAAAAKALQEVADTARGLEVERAKVNRDLVKAKEIIDGTTASYEEKKAAIEEVTKAESEQTERELANAEKKLEAIRTQNALSDSSSEALQAEADAETALYNIQQRSAENRIKNIKLTKKADNEEKTRLKELSAARQAAAKEVAKLNKEELDQIEKINKLKLSEERRALEAVQDLNDKTEEEKLARKKERDEAKLLALEQEGVDIRNLLIYNDELYNTLEDELREKRAEQQLEKDEKEKEDQLARDQKFAKEQADIEKAALKQKEAIEDAKISILRKGINLVASIFGKSKGVQKAAIIAENAVGIGKMIIDNNRANIGALATPQAIATSGASAAPVIAINNATTGIGVASSIAATATALKSLGGGSAGSAGGGRAAGGGGGASAAPQVGFQASSENQIATTIADNTNEQPILKAIVVAEEMTATQENVARAEEENSIG